jgi:site-specific DNA-methyltransferase (adenine-specific)
VKPYADIGAVSIWNVDARVLGRLGLEPVHLVITSPPYNVGIDYATHDDNMTEGEYFALLGDVWAGCYNVMTAGARVAVVVPYGVGRNPWRPLAGPVGDTLTAAGFVRLGDVTWDKQTTGNRTSWGSWRRPSAPCLRDRTEAIIIAQKPGRLEIPPDALTRDDNGRLVSPLLPADLFTALTQNLWAIPPAQKTRLGHPAPFPVDLAARLIRLYAWPGARVLDPFAGSGTVGLAAQGLGCYADLIDVAARYCELAARRLKTAFDPQNQAVRPTFQMDSQTSK